MSEEQEPELMAHDPPMRRNRMNAGRTTGEVDDAGRIPDRSRIVELIVGLMDLVRIAGTAVSAMMICSPMLLAARPKTPLRVFCIAAFEYLARLRGGTLGKRRRMAMAHACDFGSLRDDYYDDRRLDAVEYRSLRDKLRRLAPEAATSRYIRQLRQAERSRPLLEDRASATADAVIAYRTWVLDLSLRWLQVISGLSLESAGFRALLGIACLMQLADDLLDWNEDQAAGRPSYVTAFSPDRQRTAVARPLRAEADAWLQRMIGAARRDAAAIPFAVAGVFTWAFVIALLRVRFPR